MEYRRKPSTVCWSTSSRQCRIGCVCRTSSSTSPIGGSTPRSRVPSARGIRCFSLLAWTSNLRIRHFADTSGIQRERSAIRFDKLNDHCKMIHYVMLLTYSESPIMALAGLPSQLDRPLRRTVFQQGLHDPSLYYLKIVLFQSWASSERSERFPNSRSSTSTHFCGSWGLSLLPFIFSSFWAS